jgi:hypothetical protein
MMGDVGPILPQLLLVLPERGLEFLSLTLGGALTCTPEEQA